MENHLKNQTSPYLLQHADNPVNWYPWCKEAFERAKTEDKPIFLSIGYSTCHWCHVMAHESFEDEQVAEILNKNFIAIKVDKEERPDIDSIYMSVCQAFTGSGGWPTTIFMTADQKPFFAGTYFPRTTHKGHIGLTELLELIYNAWETDREELINSADEIISFLDRQLMEKSETITSNASKNDETQSRTDIELLHFAFRIYERTFDAKYGGFGNAPKFPAPHNLLFLMQYFEKSGSEKALEMVEKTLLQMYRGGIFDHIGGGFCRYSTDRYFLVPHFEKMLYDNALLLLAYCKAYQLTKKDIYREIAKKTGNYILREMTSCEGGFFSAQDADSEGVEGKYYLFEETEIIHILGKKEGEKFNSYFDITKKGNFEEKNIPNLLRNEDSGKDNSLQEPTEEQREIVYDYRQKRYELHKDDKILTSWNGLMITALCHLYRVTKDRTYLEAAKNAQEFIGNKLCKDNTLYVSYREGKHSQKGFLDDYANAILALLALYEATLDIFYFQKAKIFCEKVLSDFYDEKQSGFYLYGEENEQLIMRPKEIYDGAIPSGNSVMAYNLVRLSILTGEKRYESLAEQQLQFMSMQAKEYPAGYAMFLMALSDYYEWPEKITIVAKSGWEPADLACRISLSTVLNILSNPTEEYPLKNNSTTFYVCKGNNCKAPTNEL